MNQTTAKRQLPSIVYVVLIPLILAAFIGTIILFFMGLAYIEGFASIIMLVGGFFVFRFFNTGYSESKVNVSNLSLALGIVFYALMGMAIDQPGNFFYNKPLDFLCPPGTSINRSVDVYNPLPGRTDLIQNYQCFNAIGQSVHQIEMFAVIGLRFAEYIILGYFLHFLSGIRFKKKLVH